MAEPHAALVTQHDLVDAREQHLHSAGWVCHTSGRSSSSKAHRQHVCEKELYRIQQSVTARTTWLMPDSSTCAVSDGCGGSSSKTHRQHVGEKGMWHSQQSVPLMVAPNTTWSLLDRLLRQHLRSLGACMVAAAARHMGRALVSGFATECKHLTPASATRRSCCCCCWLRRHMC